MPFQGTGFQIPRTADRLIFDGLQEAAKNAGYTVANVTLSLLIGGDLSLKDDGQKNLIDSVLHQNTCAAREISFQLNNRVSVSVSRPKNNQNRLTSWFDEVSINPGEEADSIRYLTLISESRKSLRAADEKAVLDFLTEEQRQYYQARETNLQRQEQLVQQFVQDLQRFSSDMTRTLTLEFQQRQREQNDEHSKRMASLEEQFQKRQQQLDQREQGLDRRQEEIDDRESRAYFTTGRVP